MGSIPELGHLERYRPLVDDWAAFADACTRPLPTVGWTNTLLCEPAQLQARLEAQGVSAEPLPWLPSAFRLGTDTPGRLLEFGMGLFHVQEEVSLLPPIVLDPQPSDRVLDTCAAPGNKTAQMAVMMRNCGGIIANDRDHHRLRALGGVLERLGIRNVSTVRSDAVNFPRSSGAFDRALADVPCSCEGTSRKNKVVFKTKPVYEKLHRISSEILWKALLLCRDGGRVVYSTCTYAPEENEAVINTVLQKAEGRLRLLPVELPGLRFDPGITEWQGQRFDAELRHCARVWPHYNDTGGFFVALFEKIAPSVAGPGTATALPDLLEGEDEARFHDYLSQRFGLSAEDFEGLALRAPSHRNLVGASAQLRPPQRPPVDTAGILFMHTHGRTPKLTTAGVRMLGARATRNVVDLDRDQALAYLRRKTQRITDAVLRDCDGRGFVLVRHDNFPLGLGILRPDEAGADYTLESLIPRGWALPE